MTFISLTTRVGDTVRLAQIETRFFKSFNYDYERRWRSGAKPAGWEDTADGWYPFVRVRIDPEITAIVGANEAGKSQLLDAVEIALSGDGIDPADFCRYSALFSVQQGRVRSPEFVAKLVLENTDLGFTKGLGLKARAKDTITLVRPGIEAPFLLIGEKSDRLDLEPTQLAELQKLLPTTFRLRTDLGMPDSMSIEELAGRPTGPLNVRSRRTQVMGAIAASDSNDPTAFQQAVFPIWSSIQAGAARELEARRRDEFALGRQLLVDIAKIDSSAFERLAKAIESDHEGQIEALVGAMNVAIRENLNFQKWWTQDQDFHIEVKAREHELALVIRDRTGSSYSFNERSQGLRFFLSYYVQLQAHRANTAERPEVLLLDEPDAFLSSQGQQDLLRVLQEYAVPTDRPFRNQAMYVTHSPFLVDRNAGHRIRVLAKGDQDDGTRVVADASQNHYEPLRTSLGPSVAETAFIGGTNLIVEGLADQVMLAGMSNHLRRKYGATLLDLNEVTIVPAQSAGSVPYMVYLARGRAEFRPPCVALLDGDKAGKDAANWLRRGLVRKRRILPDDCIVEIDIWAKGRTIKLPTRVKARELEDLVPLPIAVQAAKAYARKVEDLSPPEISKLTQGSIAALVTSEKGSLWDAIEEAYGTAYPGAHIQKVGFAREVMEQISSGEVEPGQLAQIEDHFTQLLEVLSERLRLAQADEDTSRVHRRIVGTIESFEDDYPSGVTKARATILLRELDRALDESYESEQLRAQLTNIGREFNLADNPVEAVGDYPAFKGRLQNIKLSDRIRSQELASAEIAERVVD